MRELFTHEELEQALVQLGWKSLSKRGGWRRYFKSEEPTLPYGLPTIAKLPARSYVDAPKPIILDFVRSVNKRENRNVFCCWWLHQYSQLQEFLLFLLFMALFRIMICYRVWSEHGKRECLHGIDWLLLMLKIVAWKQGTQGRVISFCRRPCYSQLISFTNSANLWSIFKIHWCLISMMR